MNQIPGQSVFEKLYSINFKKKFHNLNQEKETSKSKELSECSF